MPIIWIVDQLRFKLYTAYPRCGQEKYKLDTLWWGYYISPHITYLPVITERPLTVIFAENNMVDEVNKDVFQKSWRWSYGSKSAESLYTFIFYCCERFCLGSGWNMDRTFGWQNRLMISLMMIWFEAYRKAKWFNLWQD